MYSASMTSNNTTRLAVSSRVQSSKMIRLLATIFGLAIPCVVNAETKLVKVGNPLFEVTGGVAVIPAANPTSGSLEPWLDNIAGVLNDVRHGEHITIRNACHDCPLKPSAGPYDQEIRQGLVDAGYLLTDAFIQDELSSPATLLFPVVLTPSSDAPIGSSFESSNGLVIPNDIFPIRATASIFNGGTNLGTASRRVKALDKNVGEFTDRFGETHDLDFSGLNYSHLALFNFNARHPGGSATSSQQRIGENKVVNKIRDANGNGWDVIEEYTIVEEATDVLGDLNYSGTLDGGDFNILRQNIELGSTHERLDINGDNQVDFTDMSYWDDELFGLRAGDVNRDGLVNFPDFLVLSENFGQPGAWEQGDFDGNGTVGFPDFLVLSENFGGAANASAASVPEPTAASIALLGLLGLIGFRKRR